MNEGQNGGTGFGTGNFGVSGGNSVPGNMPSSMSQGMRRPTRMPSGIRPMNSTNPMMGPVSSGQGDIVLAPEKKSRKKLWLIMAGVVGVVVAAVLIVIVINRGGNNSDIEYTGLRGAFNRYANYFLTGTESAKDIETFKGESVDENAGEEVDLSESDSMDIDEDLAADDMEEVDLTEEDMEEMYGNDSYFAFMLNIDAEDRREYINKIMDYFEGFKSALLEESDNYNGVEEFIDNYDNKFYLVLINRGDGELNREMILDAYLQDGENAANDLITKAASKYSGLSDVYETDFGDLILKYGQQELLLIKKYQDYGCIIDGEIDYMCVVRLPDDSELREISLVDAEYSGKIGSVIDDCSMSLYSDLYSFADRLYNEEEPYEELDEDE